MSLHGTPGTRYVRISIDKETTIFVYRIRSHGTSWGSKYQKQLKNSICISFHGTPAARNMRKSMNSHYSYKLSSDPWGSKCNKIDENPEARSHENHYFSAC